MNEKENFFVLDIGTRFVRGLICRQSDGPQVLEIVYSEIKEHETRAMRAGQVHDIEKVTRTVREVKESLERMAGAGPGSDFRLKKTALAVAGRNLVTCKGIARQERKTYETINENEIKRLELVAVQSALENINESDSDYYCVGYSVMGYKMDGDDISSLLDHRGSAVEAEVLVTLLPRKVLEAMFTVAEKLELEISYLTLEPIAALESTVPEKLKSLNLALVDIGAGTSDIAVVSRGKVLAYGMVPSAGDLITETLCTELLVSFDEAERIKRNLSAWMLESKERVEMDIAFSDIFGRANTKKLSELLGIIRPAVKGLAAMISQDIKKITPGFSREANGEAKNFAVVLVGGGSLTPFLEQEVSAELEIPLNRVGIRPVSLNPDIYDRTARLIGPDAATAAGIALLVTRNPGLALTHLSLNDKRVTVMSSEKNPNILSVLISQGITTRQIYGRPGLAKTFTINGKFYTVRGEAPRPASIELNGEKAALDTAVKEGDKVVFYPAKDGKDALKRISELESISLPKIKFNGRETLVPAKITINNHEVPFDTFIEDRDVILYSPIASLPEIFKYLVIDLESFSQKEMLVEVDGEETLLKSKNYYLKINGIETEYSPEIIVHENDEVEFGSLNNNWKIGDFVQTPPAGRDLRVKINGEEYVFPGGKGKILLNGEESSPDVTVRNGDVIETVFGQDAEAALVDVFRFISLDPREQSGKRIKLLINDVESQYTSPLHENAEVKVLFE